MPLSATFGEDLVRSLAPDERTFQGASELAGSANYRHLGVSSDGTWLLGDYLGSGPAPYRLSADFHIPEKPEIRSGSPSRVSPDKYALGMLLKYARNPGEFGDRNPDADLLARRDRVLATEERKKGVFAKRGGKNNEEKARIARIEALDAFHRTLADLVAKGNWYGEGTPDLYEKLVKQLNDAKLPALAAQLKRFALVSKEKGLKEPERVAAGGAALGQLWQVHKKTLEFLNNPHPEPGEEDAIIEDYLELSWGVDDLVKRGYGKVDLNLFELSYERLDDEGRAQRLEVSSLVDLDSGEILQSISYRPFKGLTPVPEQVSYNQPISVSKAAIYPGSLNRRVRWEKTAEGPGKPLPEALEAAYGHAIPELEPIVEEFRNLLRNPYAPHEAVMILLASKIGKIGEKYIVEDSSGGRLELKDRRKDYSHLFNLQRAAGMMKGESPAMVVRLTTMGGRIVGVPLAMLTPKHHLRLCV